MNENYIRAAELLMKVGNADKPTRQEYISVKDACLIANVSRWTIARWIKRGYIRAIKTGLSKHGRVKILKASLYAYLASLEIQPTEIGKGDKI